MSNYLVPTDFSDCATKATKVAMDLASKSNSDLHFLHVLSVPVDWISLEDSAAIYPEVTKQVRQCQTHLDRLIEDAEGLGLKAFKHIAYNKNYKAILDHIKSHDISMVVMGSTGATGLKELLIGSNTQKIVRLSSVPVFVVKNEVDESLQLDHMVFVSDFNEEVMDQFKRYVQFVQTFEAKLSLLFVNTPENFTDTLSTKIRMGNYAMHAPGAIENTHIFNSYNFLDGLETFCKEQKIDAIGMITHGKSSGLHLFNGSLTEKVVNHSKLPVLTMHFSP